MIVLQIPLSELHSSAYNRAIGDLAPLRESLLQLGQLQPVIATARAEGGYRLIAGHRRHAAARMIGWRELAAVIFDGAKADLIHAADNLVRRDLCLAERADLAAELLERHPVEAAAKAFAVTPAYLRRLARLRRELAPDAWASLVTWGESARAVDWMALLQHPTEQQVRLAAKNARAERPAARVRRLREIEEKILDLPARDPRGDVLRWVLCKADFPNKSSPVAESPKKIA